MGNTKKLIGIICLTIYVTLVTVGCAVFGYLYFANRTKSENPPVVTLTRAEAQVVVNKVYEERGLSKKTSALSMEYKPYLDETFDDSKLIYAYMHDTSIILTKSLLDSDLKTNTWYKSNDLGFSGFIRFYIDKQTVYFENTGILDNSQPADAEKYQHCLVCYVTKVSETEWTSGVFWQTLTSVDVEGDDNTGCVMASVNFKSENGKIYEYTDREFSSKNKSVVTEKFSNVSDLLHVYAYDCNLKTDKVLDPEIYTDDEKLKIANDLVDTSKELCKIRTLADFGDYSTDLPEEIFKPAHDYIDEYMSTLS